jgi:hypothetical protein
MLNNVNSTKVTEKQSKMSERALLRRRDWLQGTAALMNRDLPEVIRAAAVLLELPITEAGLERVTRELGWTGGEFFALGTIVKVTEAIEDSVFGIVARPGDLGIVVDPNGEDGPTVLFANGKLSDAFEEQLKIAKPTSGERAMLQSLHLRFDPSSARA